MTAFIVVGLGWGDEGKGTVVDFVTRTNPVSLVVRFSGGCQAEHNVVTPDGRHHTFSQWGAGTLSPVPAPTLLSRHVIVDPDAMDIEGTRLQMAHVDDPYSMLTVDRRCLVTTPWHRMANVEREKQRDPKDRHGSCGRGIGEAARQDAQGLPVLRWYHLGNYDETRSLVAQHAQRLADEFGIRRSLEDEARWSANAVAFASRVNTGVDLEVLHQATMIGDIVFEGSQGVLLDENRGFHPHTTWSTVTDANAQHMLDQILFGDERVKIGVMRSYSVRHGFGPMPTFERIETEEHNGDDGPLRGAPRVGPLDLPLTKYAVDVLGGVDALAVTHMDKISQRSWRHCARYVDNAHLRVLDSTARKFRSIYTQAVVGTWLADRKPVIDTIDSKDAIPTIQSYLGAPVSLTSWGPRASDKTQRRALASGQHLVR